MDFYFPIYICKYYFVIFSSIENKNYRVENFKTNEIYYYDTYQDAISKIDDFIIKDS